MALELDNRQRAMLEEMGVRVWLPGTAFATEAEPVPVRVVPGGVLRQDSVRNMLGALSPEVTHVLVHDAARSLAPTSLCETVCEALADGHPAVVPVVAMTDTVARVEGEFVVANVPREDLRLVQTPQGFQRHLLQRAHDECPPGQVATDDASLVSRSRPPS